MAQLVERTTVNREVKRSKLFGRDFYLAGKGLQVETPRTILKRRHVIAALSCSATGSLEANFPQGLRFW